MKKLPITVFLLLGIFVGDASARQSNPSPKEEQLPLATAPTGTPVVRQNIPPKPDISHDHEDWNIEFTGEYWLLKPTGNVKTVSTPANLAGDLGISGFKSHAFARLSIKPARKHEFQLEGIPYRLQGATTLNRELQFAGHTLVATDAIASKINMISVNFDYQYDFVSRPNGFAGIIAGLGYLDAIAKATDTTANVTQSNRARAVFPMLGFAFRGYPANSGVINWSADVKGMRLANYGYYLLSRFAVGFSPKHTVTIQLGYSFLGSDVHNKFRTEGVKAQFYGPTLAVQLRNR